MKKIFSFLCAAVFLLSCSDKDVKITVENPSDFDRNTDLVEVPVENIKSKVSLAEGQAYIVKNAQGEVITSQVTSDGKLIFPSNLKAKESATFTISAGQPQDYKAQTFGRFITERKDDFAWENDRVAFRVYGPALVAVDGPSNGIDIWYKRTNDMVIDKWYKADLAKEASYHDDHGEGLDDYKVGHSLGAGAMAPYINDTLIFNENFASQEVLDNGPLRTTFKLTYKNMDVDGTSISESRTISIDAGSQFSKVVQEYGANTPIKVAAGIAKREANDSIITSVENGYIVYTEPSVKAGNVFVGLLFPSGIDSTAINTYSYTNPVNKKTESFSHVLGITNYQPNTPLTYYTGYGWTKFGFANEGEFKQYVENFANGLKEPLIVKY